MVFSMRNTRMHKGFTMVEIIIVIAILAIIATISVMAFVNMHKASTLRGATSDVYESFTRARELTLASENDTVYGVHLATSSVTRFAGGTYSAGSASNTVFTFGSIVSATGTLVMQNANITFERLTGKPSATGTIYVRNGLSTSSVTIYGSGLIEYE